MKRFSMITLFIALLLFTGNSFAQSNLKFGHINVQELFGVMPERDSAEAKFVAYNKDLYEQLEELQVEFNNKYQTFLQRRTTFTDAIREQRERELAQLEQNIREFEQTAQQEIQRVQGELMQPIIEKADNAIKKVAKREGYIYVFDVSLGSGIVYFSEKSDDLLPLVKKELSIQ